MLINIIKNFIYEKKFKNITIKDVKCFYTENIIVGTILTIIFSLITSVLFYIFDNFGKDSILLGVPLFILFLFSNLITIVLFGISGTFLFERLFSIKKIMKKIEENSFILKLRKKDNIEPYYELNGEYFFNQNSKMLKENLTTKEIENLINDFIKAEINEKDIKIALKNRLNYKDKFEITLEDFCFATEELDEIFEEKKEINKKLKISKIIDNIYIKT